jgi:hypothetical protein
MKDAIRRPDPSWRVSERRVVRPELWVLATLVVGMLLVEVGGSARVAELSLSLEQTNTALQQAHARLDFVRAELERRHTRAELAPLASKLGLAPPEQQQVVILPAEYLAQAERGRRSGESHSLRAWAERASRLLVPEARARGRTGS